MTEALDLRFIEQGQVQAFAFFQKRFLGDFSQARQ